MLFEYSGMDPPHNIQELLVVGPLVRDPPQLLSMRGQSELPKSPQTRIAHAVHSTGLHKPLKAKLGSAQGRHVTSRFTQGRIQTHRAVGGGCETNGLAFLKFDLFDY